MTLWGPPRPPGRTGYGKGELVGIIGPIVASVIIASAAEYAVGRYFGFFGVLVLNMAVIIACGLAIQPPQ